MKILVTGSSGFLGGAFVRILEKRGIPYIPYDHRHPERLRDDFDSVVHFGGLTPISDTGAEAASRAAYWEANVDGTRRLLEAVSENKKLTRFVNIGSSAEYGSSTTPISEDAVPAPSNDYGKSKLEQSKLVERFARERNITTINLRVFNVAGVRKPVPAKVKRNIFERLVAAFGEEYDGFIDVTHPGDTRDYLDPEDIAEAALAALRADIKNVYELVNVASERGVTVEELVRIFSDATGKTCSIRKTTKKPTRYVGTNAKARKLLGWTPRISLAESVSRMLGAQTRVLIVGAGVAGQDVARALRTEGRGVIVAGFVDDDPAKKGKTIEGIKVLGRLEALPRLVSEERAGQVVISAPSVGKEIVRRVTDLLPPGFPIKVLPSVSSVLLGKVNLSYIRDIDPSDLIGRPLVKADQQFIAKHTKGKTFLVTGGAGSIGSEIVRQLYASQAARIIVIDSWEEGVFNLLEEFPRRTGAPKVEAFIGNVRDKKRLDEIVRPFTIDVIFHAAALKHVPLMEANPDEARKTNYLGTKHVLDLAVKYRVRDFVLISTDKAVRPKSVMGKTKRAAELLVLSYARKHRTSRFSAVRFGNVLNSSGSILPKFLRQIRARSPVTITHRDMTRYFMSIPEAVSLVLLSWIVAKNGQILLLDMGEPTRILDLAIDLIKMHGLEPYTDIAIEEIGVRPGEKLHEELSYRSEELERSPIDRILIAEEIES